MASFLDEKEIIPLLWGLIIIGLLGLYYSKDWSWHTLLSAIFEALLIAGILGLTVDTYVRYKATQEIARDTAQYLIGYQLPAEMQGQIRDLLRTDLVRTNAQLRYKIAHARSKSVKVDVEFSFYVKNFSNVAQQYAPQIGIEDVDKPKILRMSYHPSGGAEGYSYTAEGSGDKKLEASHNAKQRVTFFKGQEVTIKPTQNLEHQFIIQYSLSLPEDYHDIFSFTGPTIGVALTVEHPSDITIRPDGDNSLISAGDVWEFKRLFLRGQFIGIRWFPANTTSEKS